MKLKDYLKYYIGAKCLTPMGKGTIVGVLPFGCRVEFDHSIRSFVFGDIRLILRCYTSLTGDEYTHILEKFDSTEPPRTLLRGLLLTPDLFHYLIELKVDVFGLHEAGLCIYKNEIENN